MRWRGQGTRFTKKKDKFWWSGNEGTGGAGIMVKKELCEKDVEALGKSDKSHGAGVIF